MLRKKKKENEETKTVKNPKWEATRTKLIRLLLSLWFIFAYLVATIPFFVEQYAKLGQTATISGLTDTVDSMSDEEIAKAFELSAEYNAKIYEQQKYAASFSYKGDDSTDDEYESLPYEDENGRMGYISIPKINVNLAIAHGTSTKVLESMAGHLHGTSLPTGGESTHAVISAHTGLRSATLFSDLDELEEGDYFDIYILKEVHRYEVDQIIVCLPEEADQYLSIEEGEDLVTLYTCTPYGVNSHRLLVRGHRIEYTGDAGVNTNLWMKLLNWKNVLSFLGVIGGFILGLWWINHGGKKGYVILKIDDDVSLNASKAELEDGKVLVAKNKITHSKLRVSPTKDGFIFVGWFDKDDIPIWGAADRLNADGLPYCSAVDGEYWKAQINKKTKQEETVWIHKLKRGQDVEAYAKFVPKEIKTTQIEQKGENTDENEKESVQEDSISIDEWLDGIIASYNTSTG